MTPDELTQVVDAVDVAMGRRMEQVYGTIEELREQVAGSVQVVLDTGQVLNDNLTAVMGRMAQAEGSVPAEFTEMAGDAWRRFIVGEAEHLGLKIMVPKS